MATTSPTKDKKASKNRPTVRVTLSTFDDSAGRPTYREVRKAKLKDFADISKEDYSPCGMTPLLDAMGEFIEAMRARRAGDEVQVGLLLDESGSMGTNAAAVIESVNEFVAGLRKVKKVDPKVAGKGFLVVATDGLENASHKFTYEQIRKLVSKCEKDGWVTIFLGAGIDGWGQGRQVGVSGRSAHAQTISTVNTPKGTRSAMRGVTASTAHYLADSDSYLAAAAAAPSSSILEDGDQVTSNIAGATPEPKIPTPPPVPAYKQSAGRDYDPSDALKKASNALTE